MLIRAWMTGMLAMLCIVSARADEYLRQTILATAQVALEAKFAQERGNFIEPGKLISEQLMTMIGGPPQPIIEVRPGVYLFSACRAGDCKERGAVIVNTRQHGLLAGAWRHYQCRREDGLARCDASPTVSIFEFPGIGEEKDQAYFRSLVEQWAVRNREAAAGE